NATVGRVLADSVGLRRGEELFLTCLLQDIGMLALARIVPDLYSVVADQRAHDNVIQVERDQLGVDHAAVGGWMLKSWHVPDPVAASQRAHDDVIRAERARSAVERAAGGGWMLTSGSVPGEIERGVSASDAPSRGPKVHPNGAFVRCARVAGLIAEQLLAAGS